MKTARKWKLSPVQTNVKQWLADISLFKSAKEDFTTTLACQLDTGATYKVIRLDDLSAITQLGDPPINNYSAKLKLFGGATLKPAGECKVHVRHHGKRQIGDTPPQKCQSECLLSKHHYVLSGSGHIAKIVVDPSCEPIQHSPRSVPVAP